MKSPARLGDSEPEHVDPVDDRALHLSGSTPPPCRLRIALHRLTARTCRATARHRPTDSRRRAPTTSPAHRDSVERVEQRAVRPATPSPAARAAARPGTLRIGQIGGVDVLVRSSWLLVAALIAVLLAPAVEPGRAGARRLEVRRRASRSRCCSTSRSCCTRPRTP